MTTPVEEIKNISPEKIEDSNLNEKFMNNEALRLRTETKPLNGKDASMSPNKKKYTPFLESEPIQHHGKSNSIK